MSINSHFATLILSRFKLKYSFNLLRSLFRLVSNLMESSVITDLPGSEHFAAYLQG